ncbi:flagellar basal body rod protein FlgB [Allopusillimonas ginsengisoli]|uniref:flagellar basal body rod protein FlgB n=1 Tax=Allopusillimonas ginsengisoli TaxID=453575 RepID=UPI00101E8A6D|nr:flagellar basal body rod protein FlgB [Allopusillimonas ginsengisoli]TEA79416.1 flagellar basal body rod protein FlgB [Allopusillimonas ginsengisoli]
MIDRLGEELGFYRQALSLRHYRQEVLAANIANADTPNYKARDFDFPSTLKKALSDASLRLSDTQLTLTSARHIPAKASTLGPEHLLYRQPLQPSMDGNTVDMDTERLRFADNALHYQADLAAISARIRTMMTALQQ